MMSGGHSAALRVRSSATRRCNACMGVSPGRMRPETSGPGTWSPANPVSDRGAGASVGGSALLRSAAASVARPLGSTPAVRRPWPLRRFAGGRPNSRWSHRRRVSRPISTPTSRRPAASVSTDSPACLSRSNSSRWDASRKVAWLRGNRDCSTASAKVVGREVVSGEWMGSDMVVNSERYAWWSGGARGAPRAQSKRQRLDVGVLPYCFVLFLLGEAGFFVGSSVGWLIELVDCLVFVRGVFVELVSLSRWFPGLLGHFSGKIILGSFDPGVVVGGGGC